MTVKTGIWKGWREPYNPTGYIANHRSKRFHLTHCTNAKKISRKNRVSLETMWAALEKGYVPAKGCINHQLGWRAP